MTQDFWTNESKWIYACFSVITQPQMLPACNNEVYPQEKDIFISLMSTEYRNL